LSHRRKTWLPGTRQHKAGHDDIESVLPMAANTKFPLAERREPG
jgi:hypothetical protein